MTLLIQVNQVAYAHGGNQIFTDVSSPNPKLVERAWAAALVLVLGVFFTTLIARLVQRRSRIS